MKIKKLSSVFGAEIDGVDLKAIDDGDFEEVYRAWVEYGVLRFRDQKLDDPQLEAFSARFGPLEKIPLRMTPEQAIMSATSLTAELLGWEDKVGEIAAGKYADIIAVHGDALDDISELEDVDFVMKGGVVYKNK